MNGRRHLPLGFVLTSIGLSFVLLLGGLLGEATAQPKPEGEMRWALYVTLSPVWFDPGEVVGLITPFWVLYAFYGMLIDGLQIGYVQGFGYNQVLPAPEAEIPERYQRAEQVFAQKLWREQLRDWDEHRKPSSIATLPGAAGRQSGRPLRCGAGRLSDALPRTLFPASPETTENSHDGLRLLS